MLCDNFFFTKSVKDYKAKNDCPNIAAENSSSKIAHMLNDKKMANQLFQESSKQRIEEQKLKREEEKRKRQEMIAGSLGGVKTEGGPNFVITKRRKDEFGSINKVFLH